MSESITGLEGGGLFPRLQERYGLNSDPLAMEAPFYPGAQRQHALETLRHLCGFGDMALVLTGARGAGKTRLLGELVRSEGARLEFLRLQSGRLDSPETLVRTLYQGIGRDRPEGLSAREALRAFMVLSEEATRKGRRQVLLLDDADQASENTLGLLLDSFLDSNRSTSAVPVFAGGPDLPVQPGPQYPVDELIKGLGLPVPVHVTFAKPETAFCKDALGHAGVVHLHVPGTVTTNLDIRLSQQIAKVVLERGPPGQRRFARLFCQFHEILPPQIRSHHCDRTVDLSICIKIDRFGRFSKLEAINQKGR